MKKQIKYKNYRCLTFLLILVMSTCFSMYATDTVFSVDSLQMDKACSYGPVGVEGSVIIRELKLAETGDSLLLSFHVHVNRYAINNRQTWRIVPELSVPGTEELLDFPTLLITGRQKERHFKRKEKFGNEWLMANYPDFKAAIPNGTDTVLYYKATASYEEWMDDAQLTIHQYLASPKEKRHLFSTEGYGVEKLAREPYSVGVQVNYIVPEKEIKRRTATYSSLIDFPVNVSRILPNFRRNPEELRRIDRELELIKDNMYIEVETVFMEGYASPEGNNKFNEQLSENRAKALQKYFIEQHGINPNIIHITNVVEDWNGFQAVINDWKESTAKEHILAIINSEDHPDTKEKKLRALPQWGLLVKEVFPQLRRTEYSINYLVRDFTVEESRSIIENAPEMFSHYEIFKMAMSYDNDPVKRLEILELALRYYPGDETALNNYAAALIEKGEISTAGRYLERIATPSLKANNMGVYLMLEGETDAAEKYLKTSDAKEAVHNLEELKKKIEDDIKMQKYKNR